MAETAREMLTALAPDFTELTVDSPAESDVDGPIGWQGYGAAHRRAVERSGEAESVCCGSGTVGTTPVTLIAFEFAFLGGSLGRRTGDRIEAAFTAARRTRTPVVSLIATGGSRMQEGMRALSQLQRIARQSALVRAAGLPQLAVLRDPTTGGGWATLGAGADVAIALSGAQIGFAGSRVRPDGDDAAYTAESQLACGHVDRIVSPEEVERTLHRWLRLLGGGDGAAVPAPDALGTSTLPRTGWDAVTAARAAGRPRADVYLDAWFDWRERTRAAANSGVDCGFGWRDGRTVAYAAQLGTDVRPAGFRAAARLVRLADRLGIPVLTLVDTPGAANDGAAERDGAGPAIAEMFAAVAEATVPVTTLVIGEGGSGGALAFAAPGRTWATPDSYFSVTSPEAAARILKRDAAEVPATAEQLRLRPQDLVDLGVANGIVGTAR
jgi:acetyl-CoA carboxylase beta subunit